MEGFVAPPAAPLALCDTVQLVVDQRKHLIERVGTPRSQLREQVIHGLLVGVMHERANCPPGVRYSIHRGPVWSI
jgi:hypothetical protein